MAYGDGDRGVGGWLAFFLVTLGIITPGFGIITTLLSFSDADAALAYRMFPGLASAAIGIMVLAAAVCWFACWRFLTVFKPSTVRIGIATLVFLALVSIVIEPMALSVISGLGYGEIMSAAGPAVFRPIVYSTVWTLYLLNSKRVRNTYSGLGDQDELGEVFQ